MTRLSRILRDYRTTGALHAQVPVQSVVRKGVFATKGGDLFMVLAVKGPDGECLDADDHDAVARRFEAALRSLDERYRLYQYLLKREERNLPTTPCANPIAEEARRSRIQSLQNKTLYALEAYFVVAYEGWQPGAAASCRRRGLSDPARYLRERFSTAHRLTVLQQEVDQAAEQLRQKVTAFAAQAGERVEITTLDTQAAYAVLRRLTNYTRYKADGIPLRHAEFVDFQLCDSTVECHREFLRLDDDYVGVLSLKELPARTFAHMLRGFHEIPGNAVIATEWKREETQRVRSAIQSKRRHFHNTKTSLGGYFMTDKNAGPPDVLVDDGAVGIVAELGRCFEEIEVHGRFFGQFSCTIVLYGRDWPSVRHAVDHCFKLAAAHDVQLVEESYNRLNAWLSVLPGNHAYNLRRLYLLSTNYADLSFLFTPDAGHTENAHLGGEYLAAFETASHTPFYLNLHAPDVAHAIVLGASGSGKSFLLNFLLAHLQKYDPRTFIFDLGGSYKTLTQLLGGSYLEFGEVRRDATINPFALPKTEENLRFLLAFIKVLIESKSFRMTADQEQELYEQINNLYEVAPDQRRLFTLSNILSAGLKGPLRKWVFGGAAGDLFDHAEDTLTLAPFQTFDLTGMDQAAESLEPLLFYVLHRAQAAVDSKNGFKCFVLDEAWRFFRHPVIRDYVVEAVKTWRKKNAAIILATQSVADLSVSEMLSVVAEGCPTQFFLANPGMDREFYRSVFHLNETEAGRIAKLQPKGEMLLKQPGISKVLSLDVSPKEYWIYTNHPPDNERRRAAFERYGLVEGLEELVRRNA
jgi:type IV secretion system protein VirB4